METREEKIEKLCRIAAITFTMARGFNLWNQRLEHEAKELRQVHTQDSKMALSSIVKGCQMASVGARHFEDWATRAGVTESGHCGDEKALEAYLTDGAWVAVLAGATFNAARYDDDIRLQIESLCKLKTTGEPYFSWAELESMKPRL